MEFYFGVFTKLDPGVQQSFFDQLPPYSSSSQRSAREARITELMMGTLSGVRGHFFCSMAPEGSFSDQSEAAKFLECSEMPLSVPTVQTALAKYINRRASHGIDEGSHILVVSTVTEEFLRGVHARRESLREIASGHEETIAHELGKMQAAEFLRREERAEVIRAAEILYRLRLEPFANYLLANEYKQRGSLERAAALYRQAADHKIPEAMYFLALMHKNRAGGLAQDWQEIDRLLTAAAKLGYREARFELGRMYLEGFGETEPNLQIAERWLHQAADQWHPRAMFFLGQMYEGGVPGVLEMDKEMAAALYNQAAKRNVPEALALVKPRFGN